MGGASANYSGGANAGDRIQLELEVNAGSHSCTGTLSANFEDGSAGDMPINFDVVMFPPLGVDVDKNSIDLARGAMNVMLDRPASKVEITSYGFKGETLGQGTCVATSRPFSPMPWK